MGPDLSDLLWASIYDIRAEYARHLLFSYDLAIIQVLEPSGLVGGRMLRKSIAEKCYSSRIHRRRKIQKNMVNVINGGHPLKKAMSFYEN